MGKRQKCVSPFFLVLLIKSILCSVRKYGQGRDDIHQCTTYDTHVCFSELKEEFGNSVMVQSQVTINSRAA